MDAGGYRPVPLGGSPQQSSQGQNSQSFLSQPNNVIPFEIRKKIQMMLLLRHTTIGCLVSSIQDEYKVCYGEEIFPEMYGFNSWLEMLKAMSDDVTIDSVRRHHVVVGNTLSHSLTLDYLGRVFTSSSSTPSTSMNSMPLYSQNNSIADYSTHNGSQILENSQPSENQIPSVNGHNHSHNSSTGTDAVDHNSGSNSDLAITGNDLSQVQVDSVSSHQTPKTIDRTRKSWSQQHGQPHQGSSSSATGKFSQAPLLSSHSQFQSTPHRTMSCEGPSNCIPVIDLSDDMDDDSDFSTVPVDQDIKHVVTSLFPATSQSLSGRAVPDKDNTTSSSNSVGSDSAKRSDVSSNSKKRRILSGSSLGVAATVPNTVQNTNLLCNSSSVGPANPTNLVPGPGTSALPSAASGSSSASTCPAQLISTQLSANSSLPTPQSRDVNIVSVGESSLAISSQPTRLFTAFAPDIAASVAAVVPESASVDADNDTLMQVDVDIKPDLNAMLDSPNEVEQQPPQMVDVKPEVATISIATNIFTSGDSIPMDVYPGANDLSQNNLPPPQNSQNPIPTQFHPPPSAHDAVAVDRTLDLSSPNTSSNTEGSIENVSGSRASSISPMVKRIVSLSMNTAAEAFQAFSNPFASDFGTSTTSTLNNPSRGGGGYGGLGASSTVTSASSSGRQTFKSLPITPTDPHEDNALPEPDPEQHQHSPAFDPVFNARAGVTTRSSRGGLQRSRSQEMNSIYESFLSIHNLNRRSGGRGRGRPLMSSTVASAARNSASGDRLNDPPPPVPPISLKLKGVNVAMKHYPPLHLRGRGVGGGRRSDFNPEDMDESESVIKLLAEQQNEVPKNAAENVSGVPTGASIEPTPGTSRTVPQSASQTAGSIINLTTGRKIPKDDTGIRLNAVKWFTPDDLGSNSSDAGGNGITFKYTTGKTTEVQRQSSERYLDQYASELYAPATNLQLLQKIRKNRNPKVMCFHPFWSLAPQNRANNGNQPILSSDTEIIPALSFESVQLANLDADMGFELSNHGLLHDQLQFISSYGNFADYFCWINANKVKGMGLMPSNGNLKFVKCPGVSYDNFQLFSDGEVDIFDPTTKRNFEELISLSSSFAPHSHSQTQSSILSVYVDIFVADGMGYPGMNNRPQDLCLLQFLLALETVREGGIFVLKAEDTLTCFSVGLIYLMSRCFYQISIHKPESALPGERFIVCRWKRADEHICEIKEYLTECNFFRIEDSWSETNLEIIRLFGDQMSAMTLRAHDPLFLQFIQEQNAEIAKQELREFELMEEKYVNNFQNPNRILLAQTTIKRNNYLLTWNLSRNSSALDQQESHASSSQTHIEVDGAGNNLNSDVINGNSNENPTSVSSDSENGVVTPPGENCRATLNSNSSKLNVIPIPIPTTENHTSLHENDPGRIVADGSVASLAAAPAMEVDDDPNEFGDFVFLHELPTAKLPEKKPEELAKTFYGFDKISFCSHIPESHHYFRIPHVPSNSGEFLRAYQRDIKVLEEGLPDGIFMKGYEQRMDLFSAIILGPENTPYEGGIFVFDIKLPDGYPNVPPQFFFVSFTKHRMNPNLYAVDGKVCVSLLGTWQGSSRCELWCKKSTLLQVLVSIQGLILVNEPYFNEPGHKNIPGDARVLSAARFYNEQAVLLLIQSLIGMLEKPPLPWQFEITFILKTEIPKLIQRVEGWIQKLPGTSPPEFNLFPISQQIEITAFLSKLRGHHQKYCNI